MVPAVDVENYKQFLPHHFQQVQTTRLLACYIPQETEFYEDSKNADFESIKYNLKIFYASNIFFTAAT